ncbi:ABC transporter permease [Pseudomonas syringae pv. syringae]|nr:ABC transporter permease [Pseudomonas syringae pv. syringae]
MTESVQPMKSARQPLLVRRYTLELRQQTGWLLQALIIALALLIGLTICTVILILAGVPADELLNEFVVQTVFDGQNFKAVLFQASPMIMVGLAGCMAFRARFWNLGLEGQMIWGAIGATAISLFQVGPEALRLPLMMAAAVICGLLWSLGPVLLKLKWQVNEIISTLMLNYIAGLTLWFVGVSRAGLYLRFVDANPKVAGAVGVPVRKMIIGTVLLSGALAGLAGFVVTSGQEGRLTQSFYQGYGFSGILIAFLARNNPVAATVVALLIAMLFVAGRNLQVFYQIPFSMVQLIQAILVICVASSDFFIRHRLRRIQAGER